METNLYIIGAMTATSAMAIVFFAAWLIARRDLHNLTHKASNPLRKENENAE